MMVTTGGATIGIEVEPLLAQEPLVTVTSSVTLPLAFALKVMLGPLFAEVIVPLVIVHAYVAPGCVPTEAEAEAPLHTDAGAVMVATGFVLTVTVCESVPVQPLPSVTMTL